MATAFLRRPMTVVASSGWREAFDFWTGQVSSRQPAALTSCSAIATLVQANVAGAVPLTLSTANGLITITGNAVVIDVAAQALLAWASAWAPADCDFRLRVIDPTADVDRYVILSDPASSRVRVIP